MKRLKIFIFALDNIFRDSQAKNPYGDGNASVSIRSFLEEKFLRS